MGLAQSPCSLKISAVPPRATSPHLPLNFLQGELPRNTKTDRCSKVGIPQQFLRSQIENSEEVVSSQHQGAHKVAAESASGTQGPRGPWENPS